VPAGLRRNAESHGVSGSRILIVEDEPALVRGLKDAFESKGFEVLTAQDGAAGIRLALEASPDLILLDIMLPRVNGYEICRMVRERGIETPILMLTAKGQEEDIILGLNLGADDYIAKPFRIGELIARVNAFLRRAKAKQAEVFRFGDLELNLPAHKLFRKGREVEVTPKEFRLLAYFVSRRGRALARNDILNAVWGHSIIVTSRSIDRCVATLRAKIGPAYIETIRDIGYRFEADSDS
jgi:DNA-binding response OmpR family regulator